MVQDGAFSGKEDPKREQEASSSAAASSSSIAPSQDHTPSTTASLASSTESSSSSDSFASDDTTRTAILLAPPAPGPLASPPVSRPAVDTPEPSLPSPVEPPTSQQSESQPAAGTDRSVEERLYHAAPPMPGPTTGKRRVFPGEGGDGDVPLPLNKYTLFETRSWFYILASSQSTPLTRVLKIDRSSPPPSTPDAPAPELNVIEDQAVYNEGQAGELLRMIEEGNRGTGGLDKVMVFYGVLGFVRFTQGWYMILITKRSVVGLIGGHYIYHCDETVLMSVSKGGYERSSEETRQLNTFQKLDLSKNFYFSYTYDLTSTLQCNLTGTRIPSTPSSCAEVEPAKFHRISHRYMWNYSLLKPAFDLKAQVPEEGGSWKPPLGADGGGRGAWVLPVVHGFVDQAKLSIVGRTVYITLIGRRSRFFAGARYLKRGANQWGHVANEVETEQIISEPSNTAFHAPFPRFAFEVEDTKWANPNYSSYVQYRGSIPLLWTQTPGGSQFRPPIEINVVDPFFSAAARHFDSLFEMYGGPIIVLNLIKAKEAVPREMKLLAEFTQCIGYLNQFLPPGKKLIYIPWDMSRATKSKDQDVVGILDDIAEESIQLTGFFHSGRMKREDGTVPYRETLQLQKGVCRTNCVDCLDRTNAAQFAMGKRALGHQLYALGILPSPLMDFESVATDLMTGMFQDHGDTLALQYSGGALVNRWDTYQRSPHWNSHSRDLIENIKRYYANSLLDAEKQASIDQFLNIVEEQKALALEMKAVPKRGYRDWFTPEFLDDVVSLEEARRRMGLTIAQACDYWTEYYRPRLFTSFDRHFAMRILGSNNKTGTSLDISPFKSRQPKASTPRRVSSLKSVRRWISTDLGSSNGPLAELPESPSTTSKVKKPANQPGFDAAAAEEERRTQAEMKNLDRLVSKSLEPSLDGREIEEYIRWSASHEDELFSSDILGRPMDFLMYETTVRTLGDTSSAESYTAKHADVKAYRAYSAFDARAVLEPSPSTNMPVFTGLSVRDARPTMAGAGGSFKGGQGWQFGRAPTAKPTKMTGVGEGPTRKRTLQDRRY